MLDVRITAIQFAHCVRSVAATRRNQCFQRRMADVALGMGRWWVPHCLGTVSIGIAQAVFDMASGSPGPVGIGPAMQAVVRPGNEEPLVRWRHKRKIEHACENPDTDYTKGEFPEMSFVHTRPFVRLRRVVYNDSIPADFSPACHYLECLFADSPYILSDCSVLTILLS